jgi:hypothetical protein
MPSPAAELVQVECLSYGYSAGDCVAPDVPADVGVAPRFGGDELAGTGADTFSAVFVAVALIAIGLLVLLVARRVLLSGRVLPRR